MLFIQWQLSFSTKLICIMIWCSNMYEGLRSLTTGSSWTKIRKQRPEIKMKCLHLMYSRGQWPKKCFIGRMKGSPGFFCCFFLEFGHKTCPWCQLLENILGLQNLFSIWSVVISKDMWLGSKYHMMIFLWIRLVCCP